MLRYPELARAILRYAEILETGGRFRAIANTLRPKLDESVAISRILFALGDLWSYGFIAPHDDGPCGPRIGYCLTVKGREMLSRLNAGEAADANPRGRTNHVAT